MKPYIYSILFFISIQIAFSQTKELVLKESFEVDKNTLLEIDVDNTSILFEESFDDKIHFDYSILFEKDSEDVVYKVFKGIKAKATKTDNTVVLDVKNSMLLGELHSMDVGLEVYKNYIKDYFNSRKKNEFLYKSKDSILNEIDFSLGHDTNDYFKKLKLDNPNKDFGKSPKKFKQYFIVKVPKYVKINLKSLHSILTFTYDVTSPIQANSYKTYYKFKKINHPENSFNVTMGIFQAKEIVGGNYEFKDTNKIRIGLASNTVFKTETSKIQLGEIGKNVSFTDFNSKIHFYNFREKSDKINFTGNYSEFNLYKVKESNYAMTVYGFNTVLNMNNIKTTFGDSKKEELIKILEKKPKTEPFSTINIQLKKGILNIK